MLGGLLQMAELVPTAVCCVVSTSFIQCMEGANEMNVREPSHLLPDASGREFGIPSSV